MSATMYTTNDGELVGDKMRSAVSLTESYGALPSMNALAKKVGPNGSQDYGYRIVKRCLKKDLLELDADHDGATPQGRGAVVVTDKGREFLESLDD